MQVRHSVYQVIHSNSDNKPLYTPYQHATKTLGLPSDSLKNFRIHPHPRRRNAFIPECHPSTRSMASAMDREKPLTKSRHHSVQYPAPPQRSPEPPLTKSRHPLSKARPPLTKFRRPLTPSWPSVSKMRHTDQVPAPTDHVPAPTVEDAAPTNQVPTPTDQVPADVPQIMGSVEKTL
jgi:hypothetical protein